MSDDDKKPRAHDLYDNYKPRANRKPETSLSRRETAVNEVVRRMCTCEWSPVVKDELRKEWQYSYDAMDQISHEASRRIRYFSMTNKEDVRAMIDQGLQFAARGAAASKQWSSVVRALEVQAQLHGVMSPQQVDLRAELVAMSDQELDAQTTRLTAKVKQLSPKPMDIDIGLDVQDAVLVEEDAK